MSQNIYIKTGFIYLLLLLSQGCGGNIEQSPNTHITPKNFIASNEIFPNPERGFYHSVDLLLESDLTWVYQQGSSLAFTYIRLDDYRDQEIPQSFIDTIESKFELARNAGIKVILRYTYNFNMGEKDASKSRILQHIDQLKPTLNEYADIIAVVQAGFIGAWGEWHSSTNGFDGNNVDRKAVLEALLDAVPKSRMVQLRLPADKKNLLGDSPVTLQTAYTETNKARTGHHNDCFLSNPHDSGTYPRGEAIEPWKQYLALDSRYTVMGGETCGITPDEERSDCASALEELERFHWSYLNVGYHKPTIDRWKQEGCFDEVQRRLGYRFALKSAEIPVHSQQNKTLPLQFKLQNEGWAALYNPRNVYIVLHNEKSTHTTLLSDIDPRHWAAGEEVTVTGNVKISSTINLGQYTISLWLPDASENLKHNPAYAIRFANNNTWNENQGYNQIGTIEIKE